MGQKEKAQSCVTGEKQVIIVGRGIGVMEGISGGLETYHGPVDIGVRYGGPSKGLHFGLFPLIQ